MNDKYTKICEMRMRVEPANGINASPLELKVDAFFVASTFAGYPPGFEFKHAQRIAACWNACIGMSDYVLKAGALSPSTLVQRVEAAIFKLEQIDPLVRPGKVNEALELLKELGQ